MPGRETPPESFQFEWQGIRTLVFYEKSFPAGDFRIDIQNVRGYNLSSEFLKCRNMSWPT